jgi:hypothetical protein
VNALDQWKTFPGCVLTDDIPQRAQYPLSHHHHDIVDASRGPLAADLFSHHVRSSNFLEQGNPNEVLRGQIQNQKPLLYVFDLDSYKSIDLNIIVLFFYAPVPAFPLWSFLHSALTKNYASFEVSSPCF